MYKKPNIHPEMNSTFYAFMYTIYSKIVQYRMKNKIITFFPNLSRPNLKKDIFENMAMPKVIVCMYK